MLAGVFIRGKIPRMARARMKIKRDFKTPLKGLGTVVLMALFFILFLEALIGVLRLLVG
jgi:hypothetical protein